MKEVIPSRRRSSDTTTKVKILFDSGPNTARESSKNTRLNTLLATAHTKDESLSPLVKDSVFQTMEDGFTLP